jgi:hypothetical protein
VPAIDHFLLYRVKPGAGAARFAPFEPVTLADAFGSAGYQVVKPKHLALPGDTNGEGVVDPVTHLVDYQVKAAKGAAKFGKRTDVRIANQCGALRLEVSKPSGLLVPALKRLDAPPSPPEEADHRLDHYLCYKAKPQKRLADGTTPPKFPKGVQVEVADQFQTRRYDLLKVTRFCTPVATSGAPTVVSGPDRGRPVTVPPASIRRPGDRLVCYRVKRATKRIAQTGCGPTVPGDAGVTLVPKQPKHVPRDPIFARSVLTSEVVASIKEAELCIPSAAEVP